MLFGLESGRLHQLAEPGPFRADVRGQLLGRAGERLDALLAQPVRHVRLGESGVDLGIDLFEKLKLLILEQSKTEIQFLQNFLQTILKFSDPNPIFCVNVCMKLV